MNPTRDTSVETMMTITTMNTTDARHAADTQDLIQEVEADLDRAVVGDPTLEAEAHRESLDRGNRDQEVVQRAARNLARTNAAHAAHRRTNW